MKPLDPMIRSTLAALVGLWGCSNTPKSDGGMGGSTTAAISTGGAPLGGTTLSTLSTGGSVVANGGTIGGAGSGGRAPTGGTSAGGASGAKSTGSGGAPSGGTTSASPNDAGTSVGGGAGACTMGTWAPADPAKAGPFATTVESNVGPQAGVAPDAGTVPQFSVYRPKDLTQGGLCHPLITWGNGHGTTPSIYSALLTRLASHGFVVIASNSSTVSQGTPAPMLVGVTWMLEQNADPASPYYQRIDTTHIGATGHSEGAMATASAGADSRIVTIAPVCNGSNARTLHGPALLLCGGQDTTLPCTGSVSAVKAITTQPALAADYLTATHTSWMTFGNGALSPVELAVVAWMRVQLMGDSSLRPTFYGTSCTLCTDSAWQITQNSLMSQ